MSLITNFALGFLAALIGVIPPGLLNMSAAKIAMKNGRRVFIPMTCPMLRTPLTAFLRLAEETPENTEL